MFEQEATTSLPGERLGVVAESQGGGRDRHLRPDPGVDLDDEYLGALFEQEAGASAPVSDHVP